jgi:uncharacterized protein with GYD domain
MAKYLIRANYSADGAKGLAAEGGTARREVVESLVGGLGGSVESFYFAFGDSDAYILADVPDAVSMAALGLTVNATGAVSISTTVLVTCEELDEAAQKTIDYRPPGG